MKIEKNLSSNDLGLTGSHQAGIHVPKTGGFLEFFPRLNTTEKNPRTLISMKDASGENWQFHFIYYNNKFFGGTRNEYRLTGMTDFFRKKNLKIDDKLILNKNKSGDYFIDFEKQNKTQKLTLSNNWKIINL